MASHRFLHHTAVSFVSSGIIVFYGAFADEVLSDDVDDFDPQSAWVEGDEVTAALPDGAHVVATTVAVTGAKRKRRHRKHVTQNARKHQRRRPLAIHGSAPDTDTGSGVRQSENK